jgi:hypothetical protein
VLFLTSLVRDIILEESVVTTQLPVGVVADGPSLDPSTMLTRKYEEAVLRYYNEDERSAASR